MSVLTVFGPVETRSASRAKNTKGVLKQLEGLADTTDGKFVGKISREACNLLADIDDPYTFVTTVRKILAAKEQRTIDTLIQCFERKVDRMENDEVKRIMKELLESDDIVQASKAFRLVYVENVLKHAARASRLAQLSMVTVGVISIYAKKFITTGSMNDAQHFVDVVHKNIDSHTPGAAHGGQMVDLTKVSDVVLDNVVLSTTPTAEKYYADKEADSYKEWKKSVGFSDHTDAWDVDTQSDQHQAHWDESYGAHSSYNDFETQDFSDSGIYAAHEESA